MAEVDLVTPTEGVGEDVVEGTKAKPTIDKMTGGLSHVVEGVETKTNVKMEKGNLRSHKLMVRLTIRKRSQLDQLLHTRSK
jgi:hypothetical protein